MPISRDRERPLTDKQKELVRGIERGMEEGKTNKETAKAIGIGEDYLNQLKMRAGLTKRGSEIKKWIESNREVKDWLREIRGGKAPESTTLGFGGCLKRYSEFRDKSPGELLDEGEEDLSKPRKEKVVKGNLLDFRDFLKEKDFCSNTISAYMSAIRSFFNSHEVLLPKLSTGRREVKYEKSEFNREKVKELVNICNPREKAIFLSMFQSGLAGNEVSNLRIKDLEEVEDGITILKLRREKTGVRFITFIGRDGRNAIEEYLKIRNEGNLIPSRPDLSKKAKAKDENDYLFVTFDSRKKKWNKIDVAHISKYMQSLCKKLGWYDGEKRNPYRPHALRSSFATILNNAGIPKNFIDYLLGHKQNSTDAAYFNTHFDTLFKYYKHNEALVSISEIDKIPDSKYEELKIENEKRDGIIDTLKDKIEDFEITMDAMQQDYEWRLANPEKAKITEDIRRKYEEKHGKNLTHEQIIERTKEIFKAEDEYDKKKSKYYIITK